MIRKIIRKLLSKSGYTILNNRVYDRMILHQNQGMDGALGRLKSLFSFNTIIDVGAAKGKWTEKASAHWPKSRKFLFEPIEEQMSQARALFKQDSLVEYILAVAGDENKKISFNVTEDLDGSGIYENENNAITVEMHPLDSFADRFQSPCLLKLDTHGFEIPIFKGAQQTLEMTDAVIVEVYGFYVSPTAKLFHEISAYLEARGFRLYDIVDTMRRPKDNAFWQADAVYLRNNHPVFSNNRYL